MPRIKRAATGETSVSKKQKLSDRFKDILDALDDLQDEGQTRALVTAFVKLPSKKLYPDYYALIDEPISLNEIGRKIARGVYEDGDSFIQDFQLLYDNAVKYNDPDSWIVSDALKLLEYVKDAAENITASSSHRPSAAELTKLCINILDEVIDHSFPSEGVLSGPFLEDVDPDEYPEYFKVIENPTSFNNVKEQLRDSLLSDDASIIENLQAFHDVTTLIFQNAQTFNDPSSLIHEDSKKLQEVFEEKYRSLATDVAGDSKDALNLKATATKEPVKLKLNLKAKAATPVPPVVEEPPKKRRGRKPKKLIEEERRRAAAEAALLKQEDSDAGELDENSELMNATENHVMGKALSTPPSSDVFIRRVGLMTSQSSISLQVSNITSQSPIQLTRSQITKSILFPEAPLINAATFFNYDFEPLGFSSKAYSLTLPPNTPPALNFKVALHELIYDLKKGDLVDGHGFLKGKAEEDFMCSLYLNEEEMGGGFEMKSDVDPQGGKSKVLSISYDLKLSYGLNIINFELRLSPGLSKSMKRERPEPESAELAGRHTRHQLQQFKLNWEVEKFTIYVTSYSA